MFDGGDDDPINTGSGTNDPLSSGGGDGDPVGGSKGASDPDGGNTGSGDTDGDGVGDDKDAFPNDPNETADTDGDGVGDNADQFPNNPNETTDTDGDGVGDNSDTFPNDASETRDTDGDGVGDNADQFPNDASETVDTDGDGVGDNADQFPSDATETVDTDGDGVGDNSDQFPGDASETTDTDGDGVGDNADQFPNDATETVDTDGDGVGDNADQFPSDATETTDTDGDGVGDNADQFPNDATETVDTDGDGVGDNADDFPTDPNQQVAQGNPNLIQRVVETSENLNGTSDESDPYENLTPFKIRTDIEDNGKYDNISKPLLRTNPKISTNVKLVVENDQMYLESFNATDQLSASNYKKYLVKETGSYSYDVAKFWNKDSTPNELVYKVKREHSDFSVLDSYEKQLEETYHYGTSISYNKLYDSEFAMLAPIWLDKKIPSKFLIYRIKDPINTKNYSNSENLDRINEMLKNATLIKTVDLSNNSTIGKYIRNYVNDDNFPDSPLTVSFNKDEQTFYNGIDLEKGGFTSKGEFHYKDTIKTDKPIIEYNDFITGGFSRNNLACANLINLEFLFDDEEAEEFSINRYFGIYVDEHKLGEGSVNNIKNDLFTFDSDTLSSEMDLSNVGSGTYILPHAVFYQNMPMLGWIKSFSNYHNVKNGVYWNRKTYELRVDTNNTDYSLFTGIKKTNRNIESIVNTNAESDFIKIKIIDNPLNGDEFRLLKLKKQRFTISVIINESTGSVTLNDNTGFIYTRPSGATEYDTLLDLVNNWPISVGSTFEKYEPSLIERGNKYFIELLEKQYNFEENHDIFCLNNNLTILDVKKTYTHINVVENTFIADSNINKGRFEDNRFSNQGTLKNVADSISSLINNYTLFSSIVLENEIIIYSDVDGYNRELGIFVKNLSSSNFIEINGTSSTLNINPSFLVNNEVWYLKGGSNVNSSIYINEDDEDEISVGEYLLDSENRFNKVLDIVDDPREINSNFKRVILKDKNNGIENIVNVYKDFKIEWGMFSAYDIHDMDFDFYDESNSDLKELDLEDNIEYPFSNAIDEPAGPGGETPLDAYSDVEKLKEDSDTYFSNLINILEDEDGSLEGSTMTRIDSEFERLQENNTTEFATTSRVVPYINKWSLKDSLNVRENPYFLNLNEAFGETNFAASLESLDRDETKMTHEWFYIDEYPTYLEYFDVDNTFSYLKPSPNIEFSLDHFKDVNFDYFKTYFVGTGAMVGSEETFAQTSFGKSRTFKKYTLIENGGGESFASTIFKGIRFIPKTRKKIEDNITKEFIKNSEFNGYRFSTALKTSFDVNSPNELKLRIIQNKKFKFVVLILDLNLSDDAFRCLNRKLLYELDHKLQDLYSYSNSIVSGALDLSSVNLSPGQSTTIDGITHNNGSVPSFTSQILKDPITGSYGILEIEVAGITYELNVNNVINDNKIAVTGEMTINGVPQPTQFYTLNQYKSANHTYRGGGIFAHSSLLTLLSAGNVANVLNNTNSAEYLTVNVDGSIVENTFSLEMQDGVEIVKTSNLYPEIDINKPKAFGLTNESIGYSIESRNEYFALLTRQNGKYTVNTKPIITFSEPFSMHKIEPEEGYDWSDVYRTPVGYVYNYDIGNANENKLAIELYKKLNGCGVLFNVGEVKSTLHDSQWGTIKNHFFHKVNDIDTSGVIKLSESDDLLPKYNLINEIAIEKKNKNVFMSRWEDTYYIRSTSRGGIQYIPGTKNIVEEKSYMSSSAIKLNKEYEVFDFTHGRYETIEELNNIKLLGESQNDINYIETEREVIMDFYMREAVVKKLSSLGLSYTMNRLVEVENSFGRIDTLSDDINGYVAENIIPAFSIDSIKLAVYEGKKQITTIDIISDPSNLNVNGYISDGNFTYKLDPVNPLNFRLIYNKRIGYSYKIRPLIKIKS